MVLNQQLVIGTLVMLISYYKKMIDSITKLMNYSRTIKERSVSIERIKKILSYTGVDKFTFGDIEEDDIDGLVKFKNVSFTYSDEVGGSVKNITFSAAPTSITSIVGKSGSGKTTIANLLMRKYHSTAGQITIDDIDIFSYTTHVYAKNVTLVDQTPFMFNSSIRSNLSMVDGSTKRQIAACKRVGIHNAIMRLPSGYNTILSAEHKGFSNSQIQLLAIARALLTGAEILVFDEATSVLDPTLGNAIPALIKDLSLDHTVILVTHDKDIMKISDKIVIIDEGNLVGVGTHAELINSNKYYTNLINSSYAQLDWAADDTDEAAPITEPESKSVL